MMLNQVLRYAQIARVLARCGGRGPGDPETRILEVGSGSSGMGEYVRQCFVGCDIEFSGRRDPNMLPVLGTSEALPFRDGSFDIVVSSDMLEHMERGGRDRAIKEMMRVCRGFLILACPCGESSERSERRIASWYRFTGREPPRWLSEHFTNGLPSESEIRSAIEGGELSLEVLGNENVHVHVLLNVFESVAGGVSAALSRVFLSIDSVLDLTGMLSLGTPYRRIFIVRRGVAREA